MTENTTGGNKQHFLFRFAGNLVDSPQHLSLRAMFTPHVTSLMSESFRTISGAPAL